MRSSSLRAVDEHRIGGLGQAVAQLVEEHRFFGPIVFAGEILVDQLDASRRRALLKAAQRRVWRKKAFSSQN